MLIKERVRVATEGDKVIGPATLIHNPDDDWMGHLVFDYPTSRGQQLKLDDTVFLARANNSTLTGHVDRVLGDGARLRIRGPKAN